MRVVVYTVAWNEQSILPHFLRHYAALADRVVVYDNGSDDDTAALVEACPKAELREVRTRGRLHDGVKARLLSNCYREERGSADWVICVDTDELLFHPDLSGVLARYSAQGVTLPKVRGFSMVSDDPVPPSDAPRPLAETHLKGMPNPNFDKRCVFHPAVDINFGYGQHHCSPRGPVVESGQAELKLLHYKHFEVDYVWQRYQRLRVRRSWFNRVRRLGIHYHESREQVEASHELYKSRAVNVLSV
ncbi:MAG: glycosyltransferase family 2 protein [Planctomycetota bacterium]|jgi:glycosyltransferase involved in cell wall biosynthesis